MAFKIKMDSENCPGLYYSWKQNKQDCCADCIYQKKKESKLKEKIMWKE